MGEQHPDRGTIRFLSFSNDKADAEKDATLREAAAKIESAIARENALNELIDCSEPTRADDNINPENDTRSLYERLQEQRNKKQDTIEEAKKLSNFVAHLDEDEADYLNQVAKNRREEELRKRLEVQDALEAKKRLDEQKMLHEERRIKEALMGSKSKTGTIQKSRLSLKIKMKSKVAVTTSEKDAEQPREGCEQSASTSSNQVSAKRANSEVISDGNDASDEQRSYKRLSIDPTSSREPLGANEDGMEKRRMTGSQPTEPQCSCPKNVAQVLGVIPSSLISQTNPKDSDDSDHSDDDLHYKMMPRSKRKRK